MPIFKLSSISGNTVGYVQADNIESVFIDQDEHLILVTIDGKEYRFDTMEYVPNA